MSAANPAQRTPPGSPLYTWGISFSGEPPEFHPYCSCGWMETGWPNWKVAAASLQHHLGSNHGKDRHAEV